MIVGIKKRAEEAVVALGFNCSFNQALAWLTQKYGKNHGVRDSVFYVARKDYRTKMARTGNAAVHPVAKPADPRVLPPRTIIQQPMAPIVNNAVADLIRRAANAPGVIATDVDAAIATATKALEGKASLDAALTKEAANREPISIVEPSTSVNEWQTLEQKEVTLSELRKVAEFCKGIGGVSRARHLLRELESLTV